MRSPERAAGRAFARSPTDQDLAAFAAGENGRIDALRPSLSYPSGVVLFHQGADGDEVFYLEHGLVKLVRLQPDGAEAIVGLRSAGWFLGAADVMLGRPHAVMAVTVTPCCVGRIPAAPFTDLLRTNWEISWRVHRMHSQEVHDALTSAADERSLPASERLEQLLLHLGAAANDPPSGGHVPLKQWEIAQLLGITPQYLSQLQKEMKRSRGSGRRPGSRTSGTP